MIVPIVVAPNPILTTPSETVSVFDAELHTLLDTMRETMHAADGIGIAAPQIGVLKSVCILEFHDPKGEESFNLIELINPKITWKSSRMATDEEACLSIPGVFGPVTRPAAVHVRAQNRHGEEVTYEADGLLARAIQHELDHLAGILFTTYVPESKRLTRTAPPYLTV